MQKNGPKTLAPVFIGRQCCAMYIDAVAMRIIPIKYALKGHVCGNSPHLEPFVMQGRRVKSERTLSEVD